MARTVFFGFGAFVGAIKGPTQIEWWADDPALSGIEIAMHVAIVVGAIRARHQDRHRRRPAGERRPTRHGGGQHEPPHGALVADGQLLGQRTAPYSTATSIQKCIRTPDIDEVGITTRHNTFFQMAGNFSFGDYFKKEAISHAWQLLTGSVEDGGYGIDPTRLWATVYLDDERSNRWNIRAFDFDPADGSLSRERVFMDFPLHLRLL